MIGPELEDDWIEEDDPTLPEEGYEETEIPFWEDWDEVQYPEDDDY